MPVILYLLSHNFITAEKLLSQALEQALFSDQIFALSEMLFVFFWLAFCFARTVDDPAQIHVGLMRTHPAENAQ